MAQDALPLQDWASQGGFVKFSPEYPQPQIGTSHGGPRNFGPETPLPPKLELWSPTP